MSDETRIDTTKTEPNTETSAPSGVSRRDFIQGMTLAAGAIAIPLAASSSQAQAQKPAAKPAAAAPAPPAAPTGPYMLPALGYAYNALEPHIDEQTMKLHHDIHHKAYVDGLNTAEAKLADARKAGDFAMTKHWSRELAFHGSGHFLHTIFWTNMGPNPSTEIASPLGDQLKKDFGGFAEFKKQFSAASAQVEGSGWGLLVWEPNAKKLQILQAEKHQNQTQQGVTPILVLDVWEHAYYLKYQNKRPAYVEAWWNVVNWANVAERLKSAQS